MANPITKFLKNLFASNRVLGEDSTLTGLARADAILQRLVNEQKVPGIAITALKEGKTLLEKGYGYADMDKKVAVNPQKTIFRIASVSKPIAATALAHMVAEGVIELDASFYTCVPYYPQKKWDFSLRQLAGHTAGIRGYQGAEYGLNKPYSIKESIEIFEDDELLFQPGTDYLYNSYDWVLISLAMQEASGVPFEEYTYEKVLRPLGMTNTFAPIAHPERSRRPRNETDDETFPEVFDPPRQTSNKATFYSKNRQGFRKAIPVDNYYKLAGGGYLSTCADIAKFGQAFLDDKVLDKGVLEQFLISETIAGKPTYYGLGWQVSEDKKGRKYYGHVGNGVGGYSNFYVYPKEQMVFSILINCTNPNIQDELDAIVEALYNAVPIPLDGHGEA